MLEIVHDLAPARDARLRHRRSPARRSSRRTSSTSRPPAATSSSTTSSTSTSRRSRTARWPRRSTRSRPPASSTSPPPATRATSTTGPRAPGRATSSPAPPPTRRPLAGADLHDFGDGGNSILVEVGGGNPPLLIWAEHYDLATGLASTDFDLYDMDGGSDDDLRRQHRRSGRRRRRRLPDRVHRRGVFAGERLLVDTVRRRARPRALPMFNLIVFRGELVDAPGHAAARRAATAPPPTPSASPRRRPRRPFDGVTPTGPFPGLFTAGERPARASPPTVRAGSS